MDTTERLYQLISVAKAKTSTVLQEGAISST